MLGIEFSWKFIYHVLSNFCCCTFFVLKICSMDGFSTFIRFLVFFLCISGIHSTHTHKQYNIDDDHDLVNAEFHFYLSSFYMCFTYYYYRLGWYKCLLVKRITLKIKMCFSNENIYHHVRGFSNKRRRVFAEIKFSFLW